jgi:hypothetical protein
MLKRLRSIRLATLSRKGFVIVCDKPSISFWSRADILGRHPATLVFISFLLSCALGSWLTSVYQERQRNREATVKSMDELRSSIDDFAVAFSRYSSRTGKLMELIESGATGHQLADARSVYEGARDSWNDRFEATTPTIRQRAPSSDNGAMSTLWVQQIRVASLLVDQCINNYTVIAAPLGAKRTGKMLLCSLQIPGQSRSTADSRYAHLSSCVGSFVFDARPDPKNDFDTPAQIDGRFVQAVNKINEACATAKLFDVVP